MSEAINIVMLVKNRWALTVQALQSLKANTSMPYTLVVIDDCSQWPLGMDLQRVAMMDRLSVLRLQHPCGVLGKLRNLGAYWSEHCFGRGDWLYFSDNDVAFLPGWAEKLTDCARENPGTLLIGGQNHPYHQPIGGATGDGLRLYAAVAGTSHLMRWSTWLYNPYPETGGAGTGQSEDTALCRELGRVGAIWPHVVIDASLTDSEGKPVQGVELKQRVEGVYYE